MLASFHQFLKSQFSVENLAFYGDVAKFRKLTDSDEIKESAEKICNVYLGHNGHEMVLNVDASTQAKVLKSLSKPTTTMFDTAFFDVEQILKVRALKGII